ncbi:hypothetical protein PG999_014204 [Apiospora kogelbergensis]|uniref:Uncharacterized protein n=1 Tax=Apiospora kogelbergensis TaxID=1337665 RepID=A0AAW0QAE7_9PEZI
MKSTLGLSTACRQGLILACSISALGVAEAACNADNCYRALFPCASPAALSTASAYCQTITASGTTATNHPTRAVSACGTTPAHYLSACASAPPTPTSTLCPGPSPTPGNVLPNGDFECGLAPWTAEAPHPSSVAYRVTDSAAGPGRRRAHRFSDPRCGFIGVMVNDEPLRTVDATDHGADRAGSWTANQVDYTPAADSVRVTFEYILGPLLCSVRLDTVSLTPLH